VDGGARGNPGPAAAAAVVSDASGRVLDEAAALLGETTNNVAEYRGLLLGLERARALGADEVEIVNDSELVAKQVNGAYKVRSADMRPLYDQARAALAEFARWTVRSVPRAENAAADALVNRALDGEAPPGAPEDPLLSTAQRTEALWRELIARELAAARDALRDGAPEAAAQHLRRLVAAERVLLEQLAVLDGGGAEPPAGPSLGDALAAGRREAQGDAWQTAAELVRAHDEALARWRRRRAPKSGS
jgi:ribonuclease HI